MDTKFINLRFESNKKVIEVGRGKPYRLLNIEGIEAGEMELSTADNVLYDGSKIRNRRIKFRSMTIECECTGKNVEEQRRFLSSFFNVHHDGILRIDYAGVKRETIYMVEGFRAKLENVYNPLRFLVHLYCPDPFLMGSITYSQEMADWVGGLRFPLQLPMMFSGRSTRQSTIIRNDGDVPTPITLEFLGPAVNPKVIKNNTGEYIQVNKEIGEDERLIVSTGFGDKRVILKNMITGEETNAFGWIDLGSTFFQLDPGNNLISYSAESGQETAKVWIKWRNRYLGV